MRQRASTLFLVSQKIILRCTPTVYPITRVLLSFRAPIYPKRTICIWEICMHSVVLLEKMGALYAKIPIPNYCRAICDWSLERFCGTVVL